MQYVFVINYILPFFLQKITIYFNSLQVVTTEKGEPEIEILKDIGLTILEICDLLQLVVKVMGRLRY